MTASELLAAWDAEIITLDETATRQRNNGLLTTAAGTRNRRDQLKDCAEKLRRILSAPTVLEAAAALSTAP